MIFKPVLLVDMDEVITDFRGGACRIHGWDREAADRKAEESAKWEMDVVYGITEEEFWAPITAAGAAFWERLHPTPWAKELIAFLDECVAKKQYADWFVVTAPSHCPTSLVGKINWLRDFLHPHFDKMIPTKYKYLLANDYSILIDDRASTIKKFVEHGGDGVLFPSVGNELREFRHNPVKYIRGELLT